MAEQSSIQQKLQTAAEVQAKGIPVDWQALCVETYNIAMAEIQQLQAEIEKLKVEPAMPMGEIDIPIQDEAIVGG